jgi:hypothetical protein
LHIQFSQQEQEFCIQVDDFIKQFWPSDLSTIDQRDALHVQHWYRAVVQAGWSVPDWPLEFGGLNWSATQRYIWQSRCMAANVPSTKTFATTHIGPLLIECLTDQTREKYLPAIRDFSASWCLGLKESSWPDLSLRMQTRLSGRSIETDSPNEGDKAYRLNGEKRAVLGLASAQWMLVACADDTGVTATAFGGTDQEEGWQAGEDFALCIVKLDAPGVSVARSRVNQSQFGMVSFENVEIAATAILPFSGLSFIARLQRASAENSQPESVALVEVPVAAPSLERQVSDIKDYIDQQGYVDEDELSTQINELGVELAVLHALELRALAKVSAGEPVFAPEILQITADKIRAKIGTLQIASFGYYALPDFDARLFDNEGPLYPDAHLLEQQATGLVGRGLVDIGGDREAFDLKDVLAANGLGLNDTSSENR